MSRLVGYSFACMVLLMIIIWCLSLDNVSVNNWQSFQSSSIWQADDMIASIQLSLESATINSYANQSLN